MTTEIAWPEKTRELHNHHFDSTIWNDLQFRDDDIIISTYAKAGTTWMQQIIAQLLFDGEEGLEVAEMSPWMDLRVPPKAVKSIRGTNAADHLLPASTLACCALFFRGFLVSYVHNHL